MFGPSASLHPRYSARNCRRSSPRPWESFVPTRASAIGPLRQRYLRPPLPAAREDRRELARRSTPFEQAALRNPRVYSASAPPLVRGKPRERCAAQSCSCEAGWGRILG